MDLTIDALFLIAKVEQPERCLWAWTYSFKPMEWEWVRLYQSSRRGDGDGKLMCPVKGLVYPFGGWTFCGRNTVRVMTVNEALACEEARLEWHHYENEPTDALQATEAPKLDEWPEGGFSMAHVALHALTPRVTCDVCLVNLDRAQECGHIKVTERFGEAKLTLDRGDSTAPTAKWWKRALYDPSGGRLATNQL